MRRKLIAKCLQMGSRAGWPARTLRKVTRSVVRDVEDQAELAQQQAESDAQAFIGGLSEEKKARMYEEMFGEAEGTTFGQEMVRFMTKTKPARKSTWRTPMDKDNLPKPAPDQETKNRIDALLREANE